MVKRRRTATVSILAIFLTLLASTQARGDSVEYVSSVLWTGVCDVSVSGNHAYCAFKNGLVILDISDIESPTYAGEEYYPGGHGEEKKIRLSGSHAFVADGDSGLEILDISDPASPLRIANYYDNHRVFAVAMTATGDYAYLASSGGGLYVLDVRDPATPILETTLGEAILGEIYDIFISGDYAYACFLTEAGSGLHVLDITDPTDPVLVGTYETPQGAFEVFVTGDYAYVGCLFESLLQVVRIDDPSAPTLAGSCTLQSRVEDLFVDGDYAYVAEGNHGLVVVNISSPFAPFVEGTYDTPGRCIGVHAERPYAFVADGTSGMHVLEISNAQNPSLAGSYGDLAYWVRGVHVTGSYAYVADGVGLSIVDISDTSNPALAASIDTGCQTYAGEVYVAGHYAYMANGEAGLEIVDVADPYDPLPTGNYDTPGVANDVCAIDSLVYLAAGSSGMMIFDVSSPEDPILVGSYYPGSPVYGIHVRGGYAYLAALAEGMKVVDVRDPENPVLAASYNPGQYPGNAEGVCGGDGRYVYLAFGLGGLHVIDVSDPTQPTPISVYLGVPGCDYVVDVFVEGDYAFIGGALENGLEVVDIRNPEDPMLAGSYKTPGMPWSAYALQVGGVYNILCADQYSLMIMRFGSGAAIEGGTPYPRELQMTSCYPNPFSRATTISYELKEDALTELEVYDPSGRLIDTLINGHQAAGLHQIVWKAGDRNSGTYFYKLQADDVEETRKILLVE